MSDRARALAIACLTLVSMTATASAGAVQDAARSRTVCTIKHDDITESSGLVALADGGFVTTNDSGDEARIFVLDERCRLQDEITWADDDPLDVEALAPAGEDAVWVGDIGDNDARRANVRLTKVPLDGGDPESYDLRFRDHARNAESLLTVPGTGQIVLISKEVFGGTVFRAPRALGADNVWQSVGQVPGFLTDAAFFPDGEHLLVRGYDTATVLTWPDLEVVGETFALPGQRQGEAVAIDAAGRIFLSSEGKNEPLLEIELPAAIASALIVAEPLVPPQGAADSPADFEAPAPHRDPIPWLLGGAVALLAVLVLRFSLRRR